MTFAKIAKTSSETAETPKRSYHVRKSSVMGFSLTSPDLVICAGSPDINGNGFEETPEFIKNACFKSPVCFVDRSPEICPQESDKEQNVSLEMFLDNKPLNRDGYLEGEYKRETDNSRMTDSGKCEMASLNMLSINAGGTDKAVISGVSFQEDEFFMGGDTIRTEARIGDGEGSAVYQTARLGNFSYQFQDLLAGNYFVDLHFAEIILTEGPPGLRVFNIFIQEEKAVSDIDIYAQVGSNKPLILSNLEASVNGNEGLRIRFEGVIGRSLVCAIVIKNDSSTGKRLQRQIPEIEVSQMEEQDKSHDCNQDEQREVIKLKKAYELLYKEQAETKKALEESKREIEEKNKECYEAWMSLQELRNELMRKSMHVGSLAYAVEGQVKEKTHWFSSLKELSEKLKILKMEHNKLSEEALQCSSCFTDFKKMTTVIQSAIDRYKDLDREYCSLKLKFTEEAKEKKQLYNKILELKGNIRVFCRCRPLNLEEIASGASISIDFESAKDGELTVKSNGATKKSYKFDSVFGPQADQADVFKDTAPFAMSVLDGYNVCIFAYGQTGTGKTFTMEGTEEARGVNFRILEELFRIITERQGLYRYEISVSVLEVYNEQIRDLLASASQPGLIAKRLEIRQVGDAVHHVPGLVEAQVSNMNEVWEVLHTGSNARAVESTNANEHSSRSHCIHCVMVRGENLMNEECTRSKLWLVDLAGSERVAKTDVQGDRLKETQNINKSLSALGDVISALATKSPHIPFRNSKLTHLLQDSLGGDSKTLMFLHVSPNENDVSETLCSLNFASRVRGIELGPAKKQIDNSEMLRYKQMGEKAKQESKSKVEHIKKLEENILGLESKIKARDLSNKNLLDRVKELESQLLVERKLARQHVDTKIAENQQQQQQQAPLITKPPLGTRNIGNQRIFEPALTKDLVNIIQPMPFTENNNKPITTPLMDILKKNRAPQKENKAQLSEDPLPKRTSRASICTTRRNSLIPLPPRRNSFIPLPAIRNGGNVPPLETPIISLAPPTARIPLPPLQKVNHREEEEADGDAKENTPWSIKGLRSGSKFRSIFRRSIHKKLYVKSPLRKSGMLGDMEKVRVSIGSGTRMAHRVLASNATKVTKGTQKQQQKEKEKGWNHGTRAAL